MNVPPQAGRGARAADLTLDLIFIPGTVRYLLLAAYSLLLNGSPRLRLHANGLDRAERRLLESFAARDPRVAVEVLSAQGVLKHGAALDRLLRRHDERWFAFADTDVFALGGYDPLLADRLERLDAFSLCDSLWTHSALLRRRDASLRRRPPVRPRLATYFCVYDRRLLLDLVEGEGVSFGRVFALDALPPRVRAELAAAGRLPAHGSGVLFDTARVVNLLAELRGFQVEHDNSPDLLHIGRMTLAAERRQDAPLVLDDRRLLPSVDRARFASGELDGEELRKLRNHPERELAVYITAELRHLFGGGPRPRLALADAELRRLLERTTASLAELARRYFASGSGA